MVQFDDDSSFGVGDSVVSGPHVGMVIRSGSSLTLLTSRDLVELEPDAQVRPMMPREEARRVIDALCAGSDVDGAVETSSSSSRDALFAELASSLRISERAIRAAVRRRDASVLSLESPWWFAGHEYLGSFHVEGDLIVADRCYAHRTEPLLAIRTPALPGAWHAYARNDPNFEGRTVALLVVHEGHFDAAKDAGSELGMFGVDAGCGVVIDARALRDEALAAALREDSSWEEGLIGDVGCFAFTHGGDGVYRARKIERGGSVIAIRVNLSYDETYDYHDPPPPATYTKALETNLSAAGPAKAYKPSETFAAGDRVAHTKFGEGLVTKVIDAGKVEIAFAQGIKTLIHGKR